MLYNPHIHHRRSIRLKGYDYAQAGLFFLTICCQNRACLFGEIRTNEPGQPPNKPMHPEMILNDAGQMIAKWYYELENKFADIRCHEMIVMPNHFHCIIENTGTNVGANVGRVVQWFKTMTTNEYIRGVKTLQWEPFNGKLWQRNYWEHIIRNENAYNRISEYIINNPQQWANDQLNRSNDGSK
ncbi:MAG: transposase [Dinghuibacter sp.]|nr:transposase [Dinghuibacter sp.]